MKKVINNKFFRAVRRFFHRNRSTITDFCVEFIAGSLAAILTTILLKQMGF